MLLFTVKILKSSNLLHNSWGYEYSLILCKLHVHKSFWRTSTTYLMHFYHQIYWTIELPRKWKSEVGTGWYNIQNGQGENRAEKIWKMDLWTSIDALPKVCTLSSPHLNVILRLSSGIFLYFKCFVSHHPKFLLLNTLQFLV